MNAQPDPTTAAADESELNAQALRALREMLEHHPIAFVGAGISARCGYPTWRSLMLQMRAALDADRNVAMGPKEEMKAEHESDLLWFAQEMRELHGRDRYLSLLREQFQPNGRRPDECALSIARFGFRHIVTTNYDDTLEQAHAQALGLENQPRSIPWENEFEVRDWLMHLAAPKAPRSIVHLHGTYRNPAQIVLTDEDYERRYSAHDGSARKLFALFATQRVVFLGFSLTDPDLAQILRHIKAILGPGGPAHLALLPSPEPSMRTYVRRRLRGKFGIDAVFYPYDPSHSQFERILQELAASRPPQNLAADLSELKMTFGADAAAGVTPTTPPQPETAPPSDPNDPQLGRWGGHSERGGFSISATVSQIEPTGSPVGEWFDVHLRITAPDKIHANEAVLHLHPTFHPSIVRVPFRNGVARHSVVSYGAFTVGVAIPEHSVQLELNLANMEDAPAAFRAK